MKIDFPVEVSFWERPVQFRDGVAHVPWGWARIGKDGIGRDEPCKSGRNGY